MAALSQDKRKQPKVMPKPPNPHPTQKPIDEMSKEELLTELQYLRTENDYLKKGALKFEVQHFLK